MKRPNNLKYGKKQTGGVQPRVIANGTPNQVYQSQAELDAEQAWLDQNWAKSDPTKAGVRPLLQRKIGDPVLPMIGQGNAPRRLPTTWPSDAQIQSQNGAVWYIDNNNDVIDIDPQAYAGSRGVASQQQQSTDLAMRNGRLQRGGSMQSGGGFLPQRPFGNFNTPLTEQDIIPGVNAPMPDNSPQDMTDRRGIWQGYVNSDIKAGYNLSGKRTPATPQNWAQPLGIGMMAIRTLGREIAGRVARSRQNQYDYDQQSALGMMEPMPVSDYQPTANNLYAKMGGLQHHKFFGPKFSNGAKFNFSDGEKYDKLVVNRRVIPDLLNLRRRGR